MGHIARTSAVPPRRWQGACWLTNRVAPPPPLGTSGEQLFDVVVRHELLQSVIQSITRNGLALLVTAFLGTILIYALSVAGFLFFQPHFEDATCTSLFTCTVTSVYRG